MFKSIKAKLSAVKDDVAAGIKSVSGSVANRVTKSETFRHQEDHSVNKSFSLIQEETDIPFFAEHGYAAQDLLHGYEMTWEELYNTTTSNLRKAKMVAKDLSSVRSTASICAKKLDEFQSEVKELPSVLSTIQEITDRIVELHSHCALIEDGLVVLQNLHQEAEFEKAKTAEDERLRRYETEKRKQLVEFSEKLANGHRTKVVAVEMKEAELRREKELFYKNSFDEDMKRFKAEQMLKHNKQSLAQITLEPNVEDAQNLEDFLNDGSGAQNVKHEVVDAARTNPDLEIVSNESSDNELSNSLEWDANGDTFNIIDSAQGLDNSLELEISKIVASAVEPSAAAIPASSTYNQTAYSEPSLETASRDFVDQNNETKKNQEGQSGCQDYQRVEPEQDLASPADHPVTEQTLSAAVGDLGD